MEEKKVILSNGKEYVVKEVLYKDIVETATEDKSLAAKNLLKLSTGMSDEEYETLSMKDGLTIQKIVNQINGFTDDFLQQTPMTNN